MVISAPLAAPGYALDPATGVPVGAAMPGYIRILTGPFNVAGAMCMVLGAMYSFYVYTPKRKLLRGRLQLPVLGQAYAAVAVLVNLLVSLPRALRTIVQGRANSRVPATLLIAVGAAVPAVTSGLNRFGVTWSFFLGEFLGVLMIFLGFLISEEVFRNLRILFTRKLLWRRPEHEVEAA
jgi:hypothetical protein